MITDQLHWTSSGHPARWQTEVTLEERVTSSSTPLPAHLSHRLIDATFGTMPAAAVAESVVGAGRVPPDEHALLKYAVGAAARLSRARRQEVLAVLAELADEFPRRVLSPDLPPLHLDEAEDGSTTLEWELSDCRLGFVFDESSDASGYYFAFPLHSGGKSGSGRLDKLDLALLLDEVGLHRQ